MKAQVIILLLLASVLSTDAFATEKEPKQEDKKTQKSKYDFNIFKLYSFATATQISDSLKVEIKAQPKFRKED
ncbi:hypothetical protein N9242_07185 [Vicingaceae bacterium]|nr:hypothetical protein [Vicingaceae bacterium]